ncbi:MAG: hypothetical protein A2161_01550 [Candidatus Schekmanbacteria bacterium RBG_13_48_7]|uniref:Uncharacterized protein n=1 Tax=Candidatus Schekmanbacteria bacterium RBG_13_48_7 TaxID=1817878 RepID=A0A1F7RUN6_9BACT|nr:MAG: hypothetical protein A2161_01550 [Candidatus Schekmanbacteria bacterium RBG_13_48_7]
MSNYLASLSANIFLVFRTWDGAQRLVYTEFAEVLPLRLLCVWSSAKRIKADPQLLSDHKNYVITKYFLN